MWNAKRCALNLLNVEILSVKCRSRTSFVQYHPFVTFVLQNTSLNDSANWPSLNKAVDKVSVVVIFIVLHKAFLLLWWILHFSSAG